jgi:flagellar assembly factor FliW
VAKVSEIRVSGTVIGFKEYKNFTLKDTFGEDSPFRLLTCDDAPLAFVVVNPFQIHEEYSFELEDSLLAELSFNSAPTEEIAVLCMVRPNDDELYVNLRSPLVINTERGVFAQIILQDETYGVSVPFGTIHKG